MVLFTYVLPTVRYLTKVEKYISSLFVNNSSSKKRPALTLVSISFSHYSEKARWALDLSKEEYEEDVHCPAMHLSKTLLDVSKLKVLDIMINTHSSSSKLIEDKVFNDAMSKMARKVYIRANNCVGEPKLEAIMKSERRKDKTSVPKLIVDKSISRSDESDIRRLQYGSAGILRYINNSFNGQLYQSHSQSQQKLIFDLEIYLHEKFAPAVTDWCLGNFLLTGSEFNENRSGGSDTNTGTRNLFLQQLLQKKNTFPQPPMIERWIMKYFGASQVIPLMIRANNFTASRRDASLNAIEEVLEHMDTMIRVKKVENAVKNIDFDEELEFEFLFSSKTEGITAADITFASFCAPFLVPVETGHCFLPRSALESVTGLKFGDYPGNRSVSVSDNDKFIGCKNIVKTANDLLNKHISARYALYLYKNYRYNTSLSK